ncbi:MAG: hypothetical protein AAB091_05065 [Elusimicrobiota bacterium]
MTHKNAYIAGILIAAVGLTAWAEPAPNLANQNLIGRIVFEGSRRPKVHPNLKFRLPTIFLTLAKPGASIIRPPVNSRPTSLSAGVTGLWVNSGSRLSQPILVKGLEIEFPGRIPGPNQRLMPTTWVVKTIMDVTYPPSIPEPLRLYGSSQGGVGVNMNYRAWPTAAELAELRPALHSGMEVMASLVVQVGRRMGRILLPTTYLRVLR